MIIESIGKKHLSVEITPWIKELLSECAWHGIQSSAYIHALFLSASLKYINLDMYLSVLLDQSHNEWLCYEFMSYIFF